MSKELLLEHIKNKNNVLLLSAGGCGKSYLIREVAKELANAGKRVACTATTGIAAINLSVPEAKISGRTLHSWAGVGLAQVHPEKLLHFVRGDSRSKKRWLTVDVLFIDEVSMFGVEFFDKLDYIARGLRQHNKPFGGIQLVLSGDFLQLPPVNQQWVFKSKNWAQLEMTTVVLREPKRYTNLVWFEMLLRVRKGEQTKDDIKFLKSKILHEPLKVSESNAVKPTVLYSKKIDVERINNEELEALTTKAKSFIAVDTFTAYNMYAKREHYMTPLEDTIPTCITLKEGAQVMLKANLDTDNGLANGSRGVIVKIHDEGVEVKWVSGLITQVLPHTWLQSDRDGEGSRTQIPLILAYALTTHKSQGSTLDSVICNLGPSIFCPGQAYVALSRVRDPKGLYISEFYDESIYADKDALRYVEAVEEMDERENCIVKYELVFNE